MLFAHSAAPSVFVQELFAEPALQRHLVRAAPACPRCGGGFLGRRSGRNGDFLGCTGYPLCRYTRDASSSAAGG